MTIIGAIKYTINCVAVLIQAPYVFVGGSIIAALRKDYEPSHNLYVWLPMTGFIGYWFDWFGNINYFGIPYNKLFKKH